MPTFPSPSPSDPVPVNAMDCLRRGDVTTLELDAQRFTIVGFSTKIDAKLLWMQKLIPARRIRTSGINGNVDFRYKSIGDAYGYVMDNPGLWDRVPWGSEGTVLWDYAIPSNRFVLTPGNESTLVGISAYQWSSWAWSGQETWDRGPVDLSWSPKDAIITQVMCPTAFSEVQYAILQVTIRSSSIPPFGGPSPSPYPWSLSNDFRQVSSGTMHPGETKIIEVPLDVDPQSPPAPPSYTYPPNTQADWYGWGVARYIVFSPPAS
jgi:hypothetical protein